MEKDRKIFTYLLKEAMKKYFPIILFGVVVLGLLGFLVLKPGGGQDLNPFIKGDVSTFELFKESKPLPKTPFFDREGNQTHFSDFKGKTVLVNFWATWCEPCKEEMPTLQNLQAKLGSDKFQVITISVDWQGFEVMGPFFEEFGVKNLVPYWDNSGRLPNQLEVIGLPLTILINSDGKWIGRMDGPLVWDSPDALALFKAASQ